LAPFSVSVRRCSCVRAHGSGSGSCVHANHCERCPVFPTCRGSMLQLSQSVLAGPFPGVQLRPRPSPPSAPDLYLALCGFGASRRARCVCVREQACACACEGVHMPACVRMCVYVCVCLCMRACGVYVFLLGKGGFVPSAPAEAQMLPTSSSCQGAPMNDTMHSSATPPTHPPTHPPTTHTPRFPGPCVRTLGRGAGPAAKCFRSSAPS
jgi:hypothetical protein